MEEAGLKPEDKIKETIKAELEIARFAGIYILTAGGSTVSLIIDKPGTGSAIVFTAFGLITSVFAVIFGLRSIMKVFNEINK